MLSYTSLILVWIFYIIDVPEAVIRHEFNKREMVDMTVNTTVDMVDTAVDMVDTTVDVVDTFDIVVNMVDTVTAYFSDTHYFMIS